MAEVLGCTVPWAENYDPDATQDDGSCIYLQSIDNDQCYEFRDVNVEAIVDESFTVSYSLDKKGWAFFHDYWPNFYFHTRKLLLNTKNSVGFYHNTGPRGYYHSETTRYPFFVDVLFVGASSKEGEAPTITLNNINWVSEVRQGGNDMTDDDQGAIFNDTITAVTIWNNYMASGMITLDKGKLSFQKSNNRNSEELWNFNDFRNVVSAVDQAFVGSIFQDYRLDSGKMNFNLAWFKKRLMQGKYFIVRFEFDNLGDKQITLLDVDVEITQSYR